MNYDELKYLTRRIAEVNDEQQELQERVHLLWQEHDALIHAALRDARGDSPTGAVRFTLRYGGTVEGYPINDGGTAAVWINDIARRRAELETCPVCWGRVNDITPGAKCKNPACVDGRVPVPEPSEGDWEHGNAKGKHRIDYRDVRDVSPL